MFVPGKELEAKHLHRWFTSCTLSKEARGLP